MDWIGLDWIGAHNTARSIYYLLTTVCRCPHCQHFRNHYIQFARKLKVLSERYGVEIGTYAVSCVPHKAVCAHQGVSSYPKVKLYLDGSTEGTFVDFWALHPFQVLRSVGVEVGNDLDGEEEEEDMDAADVVGGDSISLRGETDKGSEKAEGHFLPRTKKDIYNDAYLSFDFAMRNSIFTEVGPLTNTTRDAFSEFLQFLQSCLPPSFGLQKMISELVEKHRHCRAKRGASTQDCR
jgi:hypothetical protein